MTKFISVLKECLLFKGLTENDINTLIKNVNYNTKIYKKEEIIALEGEECSKIGIVLMGNLEIQKIYASSKVITIDKLKSGEVFGEVVIFSDLHKYPATIVSSVESNVIFIEKKDIIKLCGLNSLVLNNFMSILSNKILMLNRKIKNMSYKTLRQKVAGFLIEEYKVKKTLTINLAYSREKMAEYLGIPRPSLSRELSKMKEEKIIDFYKNTIKIINLDLLQKTLLS
ncbi:Crp/Fnr family transcriptional regulator [Haloimpatiens sp. FM7315]|uniref:Crp/Fnr family transcriptional regulator n=1 Tax=Haloimpatiens sp. FM7315 TaxID=3298609 RepID=UPI00370AA8A4